MFHETDRDLFTFPDHYVRIIPVNCIGVMGAGLAKQFRNHPHGRALFRFYREWCDLGAHPGQALNLMTHNHYYRLVTTKDHWRDPSKPEWITAILDGLLKTAPATYAMPAIGCGLGGLSYAWLQAECVARFADHKTLHIALTTPSK